MTDPDIDIPTLAAVTFDCDDAATLAGFWSTLLRRPVADGATRDYASIPGPPALVFLRVPEGKIAKNRVHPDLDVVDLAAAVDRAVGLGAKHVADVDEQGFRWATLTDPEGNEFDLVSAPPAA